MILILTKRNARNAMTLAVSLRFRQNHDGFQRFCWPNFCILIPPKPLNQIVWTLTLSIHFIADLDTPDGGKNDSPEVLYNEINCPTDENGLVPIETIGVDKTYYVAPQQVRANALHNIGGMHLCCVAKNIIPQENIWV